MSDFNSLEKNKSREIKTEFKVEEIEKQQEQQKNRLDERMEAHRKKSEKAGVNSWGKVYSRRFSSCSIMSRPRARFSSREAFLSAARILLLASAVTTKLSQAAFGRAPGAVMISTV